MKYLKWIIISAGVLIASCGGGGTEGHINYGSVIVGIESIIPAKLDSDVFVKVDSNGDGICDAIHIQDDTVVVTFQAYPNMDPNTTGINPSPIYIDRYRIRFFNASAGNNCELHSDCKALFSVPIEGIMSFTVEPNSKAYYTLPVIPSDWKSRVLINYCATPMDSCVYHVSVEFHAIEVFSGKGEWIKGAFSVQIADYVQGNSMTVDRQQDTVSFVENSVKDADCTLQGGF